MGSNGLTSARNNVFSEISGREISPKPLRQGGAPNLAYSGWSETDGCRGAARWMRKHPPLPAAEYAREEVLMHFALTVWYTVRSL